MICQSCSNEASPASIFSLVRLMSDLTSSFETVSAGISSSTRIRMCALPIIQEFPGKVFSDPVWTMGIIGHLLLLARKKAPSLNMRISPVLDRVPSGKSRMEEPRAISACAREINLLPERSELRSTGMDRVRRRTIPTKGILKFSVLEVHLKGLRILAMARMSTWERWLDTSTTGLFQGIFSRPSSSSFQYGTMA